MVVHLGAGNISLGTFDRQAVVGRLDAQQRFTLQKEAAIDQLRPQGPDQSQRRRHVLLHVAHVVLMMRVPEGVSASLPAGTEAGARVDRVVSLIDIFPTLTELAALPPKEDLDGHSLVPLLNDPDTPWDYPAITTYDYDEFSIRTEDFRYIQYIDGGEELYDHRSDPEEWVNLADDDAYAETKAEMKALIPDAVPMGPTIDLMPHHVPPFESATQYREYLEKQSAN